MIVQVIIDIPAAQVNRPFDYAVPEQWQAIIQPGIRVQVPFGRRQLLGFVVGTSETSEFKGKLKPISDVMDYVSFLNPELLTLSDYLAEHLQAFRLSILQAMLPNMLKAKYESVFVVKDQEDFIQQVGEVLADLPDSKEELLFLDKKWLEERLSRSQIKELVDQDLIELEYRVHNQTTVKKVAYIKTLLTSTEYDTQRNELDKRSHRQYQLLTYLIEQTEPQERYLLSDVTEAADVSYAVIKTAIEKGWVEREDIAVYRNPLANREVAPTKNRQLLPEQQAAFDQINEALMHKQARTFLLEGVTGSGKTEVYLQLMSQARDSGQSSLLLVPEISLTPQMVERVTSRFSTGVAVLHSGLSTSEKYDEWRRIISGEATIVVGARSSIFAPLRDLGVIIIDEEHESTYKQSDNPRYHARDVALWRGEYHQCPVVLGSATPSLETRSRAEVNHYQLIQMKNRVNQEPLPPVELIDMTQMILRETVNELSPVLQEKIADRLAKQEQIILLLNRRGYASYLLCRDCGYVLQCSHCDISLTYHKHENRMKCHYCDYQQPVPRQCPQCQGDHLRTFGLGTQKVAETLNELFPEARVLRMDVDTTRRKGQHEQLLNAFGKHEADILLGTQMIAKGLDFEKVTLVGVINADTALNLPDFRAGEKTFQLLTQVAGRTGRGRYKGEVVIQTYNPDHYVMQFVQQHDYERFFYSEMKRRHMGNYPPYYFTSLISVSSKNQAAAHQKIYELKAQLYDPKLEADQQLLLLGPNRGSVARINEHYYYQLLLKYKKKDVVQNQLNDILMQAQKEGKSGLYVTIDHEPLFFI